MRDPRTLFSRLTDAEIRQFETKLGRKLSPYEQLYGQIERKPTIRSLEFRPTMANIEDPLDRDIREAREAVETERVNAMTKAERMLWHKEQLKKQRELKAKQTLDHDAKLKAFQPHTEHIRKLLDEARFDARFDYDEFMSLIAVLEQVEAEGACVSAAQAIYDSAVSLCRTKSDEARSAAVRELEGLQVQQAERLAQLDARRAELGLTPPPTKGELNLPLYERAVYKNWKAAFDATEQAIAAGAPADRIKALTAERNARWAEYKPVADAEEAAKTAEQAA